jgi:4-hydroxybenzoate polyprenyltransferase
MKVLKLLGFENLLLLAFAQLIFRYGFLEHQPGMFLALNYWQNALLVLSCVCIAAGGYLINAIAGSDSGTAVMKEERAYNLYALLTITGVGIGFYLANHIQKPWFSSIFVAVAFGLYLYATSLKYSIVVSNVVIGIIVMLSVLIVGIFNLYPVIYTDGLVKIQAIFGLIMDYALFAFVIVLLITMIKDIAAADADYNAGASTLPLALGKQRAARVAFFVGLIPVVMVLYYTDAYLRELLWTLCYTLLFILGPLIWFLINLWTAKTQKEFARLEMALKIILFFAAVSIAVLTYNVESNA